MTLFVKGIVVVKGTLACVVEIHRSTAKHNQTSKLLIIHISRRSLPGSLESPANKFFSFPSISAGPYSDFHTLGLKLNATSDNGSFTTTRWGRGTNSTHFLHPPVPWLRINCCLNDDRLVLVLVV